MAKHITGILGVNKWLNIWGRLPTSNCPICLTEPETSTHLLLCRDNRVNICWQNSIGKLELQLDRINTPPILANSILQQLQLWRDPTYTMTGEQDHTAVESQQKIGWKNFLWGRLTPEWQKQHAKLIPSDRSYKSKRWVTQLIQKLWNVSWDLWEHRNGIQHDPHHPWRLAERTTLAEEINRQFTLGNNNLAPKDYYRLAGSSEEIITLPIERQKQWLQSVLAARDQFLNQQREDNEAETQNPDVARMRAGLNDWIRGTH